MLISQVDLEFQPLGGLPGQQAEAYKVRAKLTRRGSEEGLPLADLTSALSPLHVEQALYGIPE